jgi:hypothetical protein
MVRCQWDRLCLNRALTVQGAGGKCSRPRRAAAVNPEARRAVRRGYLSAASAPAISWLPPAPARLLARAKTSRAPGVISIDS